MVDQVLKLMIYSMIQTQKGSNERLFILTRTHSMQKCLGKSLLSSSHKMTLKQQINSGAGIAQWLDHRTRDWKVAGSNPCWNGGRIFFSRVDFLCWLLFRYPFHPRVTTVARKNPGHSAKSAGGRLQLNTHTPYVCGFYWTVLRHWSQLVPNMSNDIWGH